MKQIVYILSIFLLMVPRAFSYSIITEPDLFYSFFEKPKTTIDFRELKDGTSYEKNRTPSRSDTSLTSAPACSLFGKGDIYFTARDNKLSVRADAFSDAWSFRATHPKRPEISCDSVIWFNQGISAGDSKITVVSSNGKSEPFVLYTNQGFMGIVPDSPQETTFIFDNFSTVFGFETQFSKTSTTLNTRHEFVAMVDIMAKPIE